MLTVTLLGTAAILPAAARTLEAITGSGSIVLCAHPNALPFASRAGNPPGFQVELGRALASELGVRLDVVWVASPIHYRTAGCDVVFDTIIDEQVQAEGRIRASRPYHRSGVALALPASAGNVTSFRQLDGKGRIAVQTGSLAQMILGQRGIPITPFHFEDEMLDALAEVTVAGAAVTPASIGYYNFRHPDRTVRLVHAYDDEPALSWSVAVGMRGSDAALREKVDSAIGRMLETGTIRAIYARYGIEHRAPSGPK